MLNLAQIKQQVKTADLSQVKVNLSTPTGQNLAYRHLKGLGWTSTLEIHPIDRVPVFRLGSAAIRRDKSRTYEWLLEIDSQTYGANGDLETITARAKQINPELPTPQHPADVIADELKSTHPQLSQRIDKAVDLVKAGQVEFDHYQTGLQYETMRWICECPDAQFRAPSIKEVGMACKHSLAQYIAHRIKTQAEAVAYRKLTGKIERRKNEGEPARPMPRISKVQTVAEQKAEARAALGGALRPDPANRKGNFNRNFNTERR